MIKNNLNLKEILEVIKLDKEANKEIKWWNLSNFSKFRHANIMGLLFLIKFRNKSVGFICFSFPKHNKNNSHLKDTIFLDAVYILFSYRVKGIAKRTILWSIKKLRSKHHFSNVRLESPLRLKKFYEKLGFRPNHIVMTKYLVKPKDL